MVLISFAMNYTQSTKDKLLYTTRELFDSYLYGKKYAIPPYQRSPRISKGFSKTSMISSLTMSWIFFTVYKISLLLRMEMHITWLTVSKD